MAMPKCIKCNNLQSPGAVPYCGSCWAQNTDNTMDWPGYGAAAVAMLATGKRCRVCRRQLCALPGDDKTADLCVDCAY
jgi:hypothetical protein